MTKLFLQKIFASLLIILTINLIACDNSDSSNNSDKDKKDDLKIVVINVENNSRINYDQKIHIQFNSTMNLDSLKLEGHLAYESDGGVWSKTTVENDSLLITPTSNWSLGDNKRINIKCQNQDENEIEIDLYLNIIDSTNPTVLKISKENGSLLLYKEPIKIIFNESMNIESFEINEIYQDNFIDIKWQKTSQENDTVILTPYKWKLGENIELKFSCNDINGNTLTNKNYTASYTVMDNNIYVSTNGNDNNYGTKNKPLKDINKAIQKVKDLFVTGNVHVSEGIYTAKYSFYMEVDISLYGGYSLNNWEERNPKNYKTVLKSTDETNSFFSTRNIVSFGFQNYTNKTIFDGFFISLHNSKAQVGIKISQGAPIIKNNDINCDNKLGIMIYSDGSPRITNNIIYDGALYVYGMNNNSNIYIGNNRISAPDKKILNNQNTYSCAIVVGDNNSTPSGGKLYINNNILEGGTITGESKNYSSYAFGIHLIKARLTNPPEVYITNNTINVGKNVTSSSAIQISPGYKVDIIKNNLNGGSANRYSSGITCYFSDFSLFDDNSRKEMDINIENNVITGGSSNDRAYGIDLSTISKYDMKIIKNNTIFSGIAPHTTSIYVTGGNSTIANNIINGEGLVYAESKKTKSSGIYDGSSYSLIYNNVIYGGIAQNCVGIKTGGLTYSSNSIYNNTIIVGENPTSENVTAIVDYYSAKIANNILYTSFGTNRIAIKSNYDTHIPAEISYNNIYNFNTAILYHYNSDKYYNDINTLEQTFPNNYIKNVSLDPGFKDIDGTDNDLTTILDNNLELTYDSPLEVKDGAYAFDKIIQNIDIRGIKRDFKEWSMGAYEY